MVGLMGGFYVDKFNQHREIHWACKRCIVRPMCNEQCYKTFLEHWICENCEVMQSQDRYTCPKDSCKDLERMKLYESFSYFYGDIVLEVMTIHMEETSIFRLLKRPL